MVRGIFVKLNFPYVHFATCGITGDVLFPIIWEAIRQLEIIGLKVICITGDGASPNRKFFRMHNTGLVYKTPNPFSKEKRFVYFISDPPHLVKTVRNCWSHSGYNGTRLMTVSCTTVCVITMNVILLLVNRKDIEWRHLRELYQKVSTMKVQSNGLSFLPKL